MSFVFFRLYVLHTDRATGHLLGKDGRQNALCCGPLPRSYDLFEVRRHTLPCCPVLVGKKRPSFLGTDFLRLPGADMV